MKKKKHKRKPETEGGSGSAKKAPGGRPKTLSPELDKRHQIRCATDEFDMWERHSKQLGFPSVSAWIRKVANAALPEAPE